MHSMNFRSLKSSVAKLKKIFYCMELRTSLKEYRALWRVTYSDIKFASNISCENCESSRI
jgi:hypothetical protein